MRIRQSGKYSRRYKPPESGANRPSNNRECQKCTYPHEPDRCPAEGRRCNNCGKEGHFGKSPLCTGRKKSRYTTRRVAQETPTPSDSENDTEPVARIERAWPGVQPGTTATKDMYYVKSRKESISKRVKVELGGSQVELYCDTGSKMTIITSYTPGT